MREFTVFFRYIALAVGIAFLAVASSAGSHEPRTPARVDRLADAYPSYFDGWLGFNQSVAIANDGTVTWRDGARDGAFRRWRARGGVVEPRLDGRFPFLEFLEQSPDGRFLSGAAYSASGATRWVRTDARGRTVAASPEQLPFAQGAYWSRSWAHAAGTACDAVRCTGYRWSAKHGTELLPDLAPTHPQRSTWVSVISSDGRITVGTSYIGLQINGVWWDAAGRIHSVTRTGHDASGIVAFSANGRALVASSCAGSRCELSRVEIESGKTTDLGPGICLGLSEDGRAVLFARDSYPRRREILHWSPATGLVTIGFALFATFTDAAGSSVFLDDSGGPAFRWTAEAGLQPLTLAGDTFFQRLQTGNGFEVGLSCNSARCDVVRWTPEAGLEKILGPSGAPAMSHSISVSDGGNRVLVSENAASAWPVFLWSSSGSHPAPVANARWGFFFGDRVLLYACPVECSLYLWDGEVEAIPLRLPGQKDGSVVSRSDEAGVLIGTSCDESFACDAWIWDERQGVRNLAVALAQAGYSERLPDANRIAWAISPDGRWLSAALIGEGVILRLPFSALGVFAAR